MRAGGWTSLRRDGRRTSRVPGHPQPGHREMSSRCQPCQELGTRNRSPRELAARLDEGRTEVKTAGLALFAAGVRPTCTEQRNSALPADYESEGSTVPPPANSVVSLGCAEERRLGGPLLGLQYRRFRLFRLERAAALLRGLA